VGFESGRQVEAMTAEEAKIVRQDMTIQFFAKMSAKRTSTYATDKAAKDRAGNSADSGP
jgi:hypothetical protein